MQGIKVFMKCTNHVIFNTLAKWVYDFAVKTDARHALKYLLYIYKIFLLYFQLKIKTEFLIETELLPISVSSCDNILIKSKEHDK